MDRLRQLGYVVFEVTDLDAAADFYARAIRLEVTERRDDVVFMGSGTDHHWVRLEQGERPRVQRVAYQAVSGEVMDAIESDLRQRDIAFQTGNGFADDRVGRWIRFLDPAGISWEVFLYQAELAMPIEVNGVDLRQMLHTLWEVPNFDRELEFCTQVLGFKLSDQVEDLIAFLRCQNGLHHSLGLVRAAEGVTEPNFSHFCILVGSIDDVMRYRHNAVSLGLELEQDVLRHPTSGSIGVYVYEPWQRFSIEFCTNHAVIDDAGYVPRRLALGPAALDVWRQPLPPPRIDSKQPFTHALNGS
jgi:2,3-dihydroxy-p-cumate/2,3-dihydroxybenzoate 3,4-dioxygenase